MASRRNGAEAVLPEPVREVLLACLDADLTRRPPLASLLKQRLEQAMKREQVGREPVLEFFVQLNQRTRIALQRRFDADDDVLIERFVQDELGEVCGIIRGTPGRSSGRDGVSACSLATVRRIVWRRSSPDPR